jgi:RNA polymerase sigma-70 factor (ECF subfamily)
MIASNTYSTSLENIVSNRKDAIINDEIIKTEELVLFIKSKSEYGFNILYEKYSGALYGILFKFVRRSEIADDLLQDTFVKIWKHIESFDEQKGTLFTWMLNIARNQAIDYLRSAVNHHQQSSVSLDLRLIHQKYLNIVDTNSNEIEHKDFKNKALQLEQKYAEIIDLIYFYGYTHFETSQLLDLPLGTVKTRARKAIDLLKKLYHL